MTARSSAARPAVKKVLNAISMLLVSPAALTCWISEALLRSGGAFAFWTHVCALLPGPPGMFLRRAFYRWTLQSCAEDVTIEFGAVISRRRAVLESGVYVGAYALIGWAWVKRNTLIGSRVSLLSGGHQHEMAPSGEWTPTDSSRLKQIVVGPNLWVGEGAILMADVGAGCMVAAGAVVAAAIPDGIMVAGNPARFVRRVMPERADEVSDAVAVPAVR